MTFTYDPEVITTDLAKVRTEIFDTDSTDPLLTDEQIQYLIDDTSSVLEAAARAADVIARNFARDFNWSADGTTVNKGDRAKEYRQLAESIRARLTGDITALQTRMTDGFEPSGSTTDVADRGGLVNTFRDWPDREF